MTNLENILEETLKAKVEAYKATNKVRLMEKELLRVCIQDAPEVLTINYNRLCGYCFIEPLRSRIDKLRKVIQE